MNRIVRENYPVSKLPEDLRREFEGQEFVDIVARGAEKAIGALQEAGKAGEASRDEKSLGGEFSHFKHLRRSNYKSSAEVDDYLSALRDEWAHRER